MYCVCCGEIIPEGRQVCPGCMATSKLICVEGYRAFRGTMICKSQAIRGDWLYKPDTDCWYCRGNSYPAAVCKVLTVD